MEEALGGDLAIVKADVGDPSGNLVYRKTARNFNPMIAAAAPITIAEVEKLVGIGDMDPEQVHTPGIYVKYIFQGVNYEKRIEQRTNRPKSGS
jgi:acyl CoA:acetate/3-ketoacid CoA transferase alpha subunit